MDRADGAACTVHVTWRLERGWSDDELDRLVRELPGDPCVQAPTPERPDLAVISLEIDHADPAGAAHGAHAAVARVLRRHGARGGAVEVLAMTEEHFLTVDAEQLSEWNP